MNSDRFHTHGLVRISDIPHLAEYHQQRIPGATEHLYLYQDAYVQLQAAAEYLREEGTRSVQFGLAVFDGFRPQAVQRHIFERYVDELQHKHRLDRSEAILSARTFVSDPGTVFPHGTGGTVDLTLTVNGRCAWMGTAFDDFTERAHRNWYTVHPPKLPPDRAARTHRSLLDRAMSHAGFIGLADEWWHYEWGTTLWGETMGQAPVLTTTFSLDEPLPEAG